MGRFNYRLLLVFLGCSLLWAISNSVPRDMWLTALGVLVGAAISFVVSWVFAQQATKELRKQAERLSDAVDLVHRGMEELGLEFTRDRAGNRIGVKRNAAMTSEVRSGVEARAEVRHHGSDPEQLYKD